MTRPGPGNIDASRNPRGFDPSTRRMHFGDGTSSGRVFGGNPGMFNRGPTTGITGGRSPAAALPGRPNNSTGSTAATFRPSGTIAGRPNFVAPGVVTPGIGPFNTPGVGSLPVIVDSSLLDPAAVVTAPLADVAPAAPIAVIVPVVPNADARSTVVTRASGEQPDPREDRGAEATATAYPTRESSSVRTTRTTIQPRIEIRQEVADFVEVPTSSSHLTTTERTKTSASIAERPTTIRAEYTIWQGYYWYHGPTSGWQYWDGGRWLNFTAR